MPTALKNKSATRAGKFGESRYWGLWLIAPWLLGFALFKLVPIVATLIISFTNTYLLEPKNYHFVGLDNYADALTDNSTWTALGQTAKVALWIIPLQMLASLGIATLLSNKRLLLKNPVRAFFFLPSLIPSTAFMFMWQGFVNPRSGWLTRLLLGPLGLQRLNIFYGRNAGQALFILGALWTIGPGILILTGSIQSISHELYEAARMDGAGRVRSFLAVTLPLITSAIFFTLILNLTGAFGGALLLDRGYGINNALSSFDNYIHFVLFGKFQLGAASSLAWIFFVLIMLIVILLFWTSRWWVYYPDQETGA